MTHLIVPRALETMRTYHNQVRAFDLHLERLFMSWRLLMHPHHGFTFSTTQQAHITKKIYRQLGSWSISPHKDLALSDEVTSPEQYGEIGCLKKTSRDWVIRCWLDLEGHLEMSKTPLDASYVGCPRSVASVHLPFDPYLPRNAKHDQRQAWERDALRLHVDELLLCDAQGYVLEAHNSNFWILEVSEDFDQERFSDALREKHTKPLQGTCWVTPPLEGNCLSGVTRALLIQIFKEAGAHVYCERISLDEEKIYSDDDRSKAMPVNQKSYLSSTLKSLSPIISINQHVVQRPKWDQALCAWVDDQLCLRR